MGALESKSSMNGDRPEDGAQYQTPVQNRRVQKLADPRSPTDEISRTPLQRTAVEAELSFEDPRSPTSKIARTPIPDDSDPRSPSGGREPGPFVFPADPDDPRSPSRVIARTPLTKDSPSGSDIETVTVHHAEHEETSENTSNNNDSQNGACSAVAKASGEDAESGVFQIETDSAKLIGQESGIESHAVDNEGQNGPAQVDTPAYEMVEKQTIANEEAGDTDNAALVLSDREMVFLTELPTMPPSSTTKKPSIRRSLRETFHSSAGQRSPLSTRNLLQDSPDRKKGFVAHKMGMAFKKAGARRRFPDGEGPRTVGRYQPVVDKENF